MTGSVFLSSSLFVRSGKLAAAAPIATTTGSALESVEIIFISNNSSLNSTRSRQNFATNQILKEVDE